MTALLLALWQVVKPHALLVGACTAIAGGSFYLGYRTGHPTAPVSVQIAHTITQQAHDTVRKTDTLVRLRDSSLLRRLAAYEHARGVHPTSVTDTTPVYDTIPIYDTVRVQAALAQCDSLATSCRDYRAAAQAKFHADSLLFAAQAQEIAAWKASRPSLGHRLLTDALLIGVGALADHYFVPPRSKALSLSLHVPVPLRFQP